MNDIQGDTQAAGAALGIKDQKTTPGGASAFCGGITQPDKAVATLQARAALAGYELHVVDRGGTHAFLIRRAGMTLQAVDKAAVEAFLARVGAP